MTKVEQLQAELKAKQEANAKVVAEAMEIARVTAKIAVLDNVNLTQSRVQAKLKAEVSAKLTSLDEQCKQIVLDMPIYSTRTKEDRKWQPSRQYGLGNQIAILTGILSGIQYSHSEHKAQLLALTGLDEDVIESTLEAFGSPSYYSKNYSQVIDAVPYDLVAIKANLALIEEALDINLDKSKLTDTIMTTRFNTAKITAERQAKMEVVTTTLSNQTIEIN